MHEKIKANQYTVIVEQLDSIAVESLTITQNMGLKTETKRRIALINVLVELSNESPQYILSVAMSAIDKCGDKNLAAHLASLKNIIHD